MNLSKIKSYLKFDVPFALSMDGWEQWEKDNKEKYPTKWFILKTVPDFINIYIIWPLDNFFIKKLYWGFKYRYIKKYQYNIIRPDSLKPGYYDECDLLLHSSFHILKTFVESELNEPTIEWESDEGHSNAWKEARSLYHWWIIDYTNRYDKLDDRLSYPEGPDGSSDNWILLDKYIDTPEYQEFMTICSIRTNLEKSYAEEDEANLIRLMKIRTYLWN